MERNFELEEAYLKLLNGFINGEYKLYMPQETRNIRDKYKNYEMSFSIQYHSVYAYIDFNDYDYDRHKRVYFEFHYSDSNKEEESVGNVEFAMDKIKEIILLSKLNAL